MEEEEEEEEVEVVSAAAEEDDDADAEAALVSDLRWRSLDEFRAVCAKQTIAERAFKNGDIASDGLT